MSKTIIAASNKISGNISECRIDSQLVSIDRENPWSLTQSSKFKTYNVCTGEVIHNYEIKEFTSFSLMATPILIGLSFASILFIFSVIVTILDFFRRDK